MLQTRSLSHWQAGTVTGILGAAASRRAAAASASEGHPHRGAGRGTVGLMRGSGNAAKSVLASCGLYACALLACLQQAVTVRRSPPHRAASKRARVIPPQGLVPASCDVTAISEVLKHDVYSDTFASCRSPGRLE